MESLYLISSLVLGSFFAQHFSCTFILIYKDFSLSVQFFYSSILNKLFYLKFVCVCKNEARLDELVRVVWNGVGKCDVVAGSLKQMKAKLCRIIIFPAK